MNPLNPSQPRRVNPLQELQGCGQAPWLDYLKRSFVARGDLAEMVARDGVKGVTSNPSIFEKAIGQSDEYDDAIKEFLRGGDREAGDIYEHLAFADIRAAADVLAPVYSDTGGRDGYVSLECSPHLANDTEATVAEAQRLWKAVDRPNLMVKVPATPAGLPAIRRLIAAGVNVNVTLLFSVDVYEQVARAYIAGLEDLRESGGDVSRVASVASFFVSRIDTAVDKKLDALADKTLAGSLRGNAAIVNARMAYRRFLDIFEGRRWHALARAGAQTQRLLWASTGVKNPDYKDTLYVDALIGPDTVNTMPPATLDAFRDHGEVVCNAIQQEFSGVRRERAVLMELRDRGISLEDITRDLLDDGVKQFVDAFDKLFAALEKQRAAHAG
ncbi:transaldolase [Rhodoblastus acidophilus]|uniref:transaldolase n=1 Tax=Rhodoblastus acidophilus TaxID=1074 RepID=UPI0022240BA1|nr:transaldolase [Rhodoblastus acidophilus]MCW2285915.1 transaldolase [Rhodoblastus acidophilus]MCW2334784.1 transaldolase [Rhodoblastus acidophilus]